MTADDLERYLAAIGLDVRRESDAQGAEYTIVESVEIPTGALRGKRCDVAIQRCETNPYVVPAAIHTKPALVAMNANEPVRTMASALGGQWQYWSRRYDHAPTPKRVWAHVLTVLGDERWVKA